MSESSIQTFLALHQELERAAKTLLASLRSRDRSLLLAESCTGGRIAAALTAIPGASDVFTGSVVTYQLAAKQKYLALSSSFTETDDLCTSEVAVAMCQGLAADAATLAVAVTGVAGPAPLHAKTSGCMWMAVQKEEEIQTEFIRVQPTIPYTRENVILQLSIAAIQTILKYLTY